MRQLDLALFGEITAMLGRGEAATPGEAALALAVKGIVAGHGTVENRARRLARRYREFQTDAYTDRCRGIPRLPSSESAIPSDMTNQADASTELAALKQRLAALEARVDAIDGGA